MNTRITAREKQVIIRRIRQRINELRRQRPSPKTLHKIAMCMQALKYAERLEPPVWREFQ